MVITGISKGFTMKVPASSDEIHESVSRMCIPAKPTGSPVFKLISFPRIASGSWAKTPVDKAIKYIATIILFSINKKRMLKQHSTVRKYYLKITF